MVAEHPAHRMPLRVDTEPHIAESPLKWCAVSLSDVMSRGRRLEASVFDVEAKQARERVVHGKYGCIPLCGEQGVVDIAYYPGRFKRIYCERTPALPSICPRR